MSNLMYEKLRNISRSSLSPTTETIEEVARPAPLKWRTLSKSVVLLRIFDLEGENYYVYFIHTPTIFKTRGRYVVLKKTDKDGHLKLLEMKGFRFINFTVNDFGDVLRKEDVPYLNLNEKPEFINLYRFDNASEVKVYDLLDLLDFLHILNGSIHMNPLKEVPKLTKYTEKENRFQLGEMKDYRRKVYEFVTSREKPTLSYRYIVKGFEMEDGKEVEKKKFFQYPLLTNQGEMGVKEIEVTVPYTTESQYYVKEYIGHLILPNSQGIYKGKELYFIVDTSKLSPIRTLHEIPNSARLVYDREMTRMLLKSLGEFKTLVRNMSKRVGTPIREENMYSYSELTRIEIDDIKYSDEVIYKSIDTTAGNTRMKDLLVKTGVKSMSYIENLITKYLDGSIKPDLLEKHIEGTDKIVLKSKILNEALKVLFTSIRGKNLGEMYEMANKTYMALERHSNSLKLRLHMFKSSEGELEDFLMRALSHLPTSTNLTQQDYQTLSYKLKGKEFDVVIRTKIEH